MPDNNLFTPEDAENALQDLAPSDGQSDSSGAHAGLVDSNAPVSGSDFAGSAPVAVAIPGPAVSPALADVPVEESASPAQPNPDPLVKTCRHCAAEFPTHLKKCPSCGKSQQGRPAGGVNRPRQIQPVAPPPPPKKELTPSELEKLEGAIGDTFAFFSEDFIATRMLRGTGITPPAFGDSRAQKLGIVWAPVLAPFMTGPILLALLLIAVTGRSLFGYFREVQALADAAKKNTTNSTP